MDLDGHSATELLLIFSGAIGVALEGVEYLLVP